MRAIETGLPVIRAANTGISGVLDPNGRMTHQIELNNDGFADFWLPNRTDATVYVRIGDRWYKILLIVLAFTAIISQFRKQVDVNS
jgi:apolipoprotein N-acyltransferase